jgi:hypothetical protein
VGPTLHVLIVGPHVDQRGEYGLPSLTMDPTQWIISSLLVQHKHATWGHAHVTFTSLHFSSIASSYSSLCFGSIFSAFYAGKAGDFVPLSCVWSIVYTVTCHVSFSVNRCIWIQKKNYQHLSVGQSLVFLTVADLHSVNADLRRLRLPLLSCF